MKPQIQTIQKALENKLVEARKENLRALGDIEHRLEFVDELNGVEYINDAKASDVNASWYSIDCMEKPVIWILSSSPYEEDYAAFEEIETGQIKAIIVMGQDKDAVISAFEEKVELIGRVNTMLEAVAHATLTADEGDVVLYSPACSDFDTFKHYKNAGQEFRKAVREMRL